MTITITENQEAYFPTPADIKLAQVSSPRLVQILAGLAEKSFRIRIEPENDQEIRSPFQSQHFDC